jgi:carboxylesterase
VQNNALHIRTGAEPFWLEGGEVGCVCTHGFTASPEEMRWLGEYLHDRGLTIFAPRLAGHGTDPEMMRRQHWRDWYENVLDGVALLRARCRKVFAVGISMGGLLSLQLAAAGEVDGVAALAAPFRLPSRTMRFTPVIKYFRRTFIKDDWPGDLEARVRAAQRAMGREEWGRLDYGVMPTAAIWQLYRLMNVVYKRLPEVTAPALLVYSQGDQTVPYDNLALAEAQIGSHDLVTHTLERSDHCLTQEIERETVYRLVWDFLSARMA